MKDTQGNPITEEEFMKDIGHGVVTQDWKENNIQQFLEEERNRYSKEYDNLIDDGEIGELEADDLLEDHDTRLINFILSEVEKEVEKKLEQWDKSAEELEDGWGNYTVCLPWELKENKLDISTIINNLRVK